MPHHALTPSIAAFDFDGTLIKGESLSRFLLTALPLRYRLRGLLQLPWRVLWGILHRWSRDEIKEHLLSGFLKGLPEEEFHQRGERYARTTLMKALHPERIRLLEGHMEEGHEVWIVSASLEVYLVPLAKELGIQGVCACRMAVGEDGCLTGAFDGPNCWGEEKVRRLNEVAPLHQRRLYAYGDSKGDAALLEAAHHGRLLRWRRRRRGGDS